MSSFNNATNVSHQLAAAAVVARNLQQQQANMSPNNFKGHSLLPFHTHANRIGLKQNSLPPSPSPPQIAHSNAASIPITPQSLFENHCNDNLSLLTAQQQKLSSTPFQPNIIPATSIGEPTNTPTESEGAAAVASMAAAFSPGIPAFLQHIIHGE